MTRIAEKIRKEMEEELMKLPGVVGISHENPKEKIIVYVESEAATLAVPRVLDGIRVETRVVGEVRVLEQAVVLQRTARIRPAPGGVSIGHQCYSQDTRVLTKNGLKYFYELTYNDYIATLNPTTKELEWQKPINIFCYDYNGKMIHFSGKTIDLLVTPNHNLYCRNRYKKEDFRLIRADIAINTIPYHGIQFLRSCEWNCTDIEEFILPLDHRAKLYTELENWNNTLTEFAKKYDLPYKTVWRWKHGLSNPTYFKTAHKFKMEDWLEFLGWYISEGSIYRNRIFISEKSKKYHDEIKALLKRMNLNYSITRDGSILIYHKQLASYLKSIGLCGAKNKYIPEWIKELPPAKLRILLDALMKGDGHIENGKYRHYRTTSWKLANDVLEIGLKCGLGVTIIEEIRGPHEYEGRVISGGKSYRIGFSHTKLKPRLGKPPEVVNYKGKVYCVEVPNHIIFVERNGKTCWCGNSVTAGTLGMVTADGYILSNAHVIAPPTIAEVGDPIIQPGSFDGGRVETDKIGEVERFEEVKPLPEDNLVDAAIARVTCEDCVTKEILEIGVPDGWTHAVVDMPVMKSGRTTGVTKSVIIDTNASIKVKGYAFGEASFKDQIIIDSPGASFADGGDSGSVVITRAEDGRLLVVGLLFAGSDRIAVANKIENVIDSLDIDIGPYHETEIVETPSRFYGTVGTLTPLVFLGSLLTSEKLRR